MRTLVENGLLHLDRGLIVRAIGREQYQSTETGVLSHVFV